MGFRDNLQHLRATRNMTQEQLAMLVGVSRQSVTKWEAEKAYPEMDKLLKLCQIFDCTLDELVQGNLTSRAPEPALSMPVGALAEDVVGYDEHHRSYAWKLALGVAAIIAGVACSSAIDLFMGEGPTALFLFAGVGIGLALIIPAVMEHSAFQEAHPFVANFYTDSIRTEERRNFGIRLAAGIALILVGVAFGAFADDISVLAPFSGPLLLVFAAAGVGLIVWAAIMNSRIDIEEYNIDALEDLSEEAIASIVGEERAPEMLRKVKASRLQSTVCAAIMLIATAIALPLMFWATDFGEPFWSRYFWIPWMVGGLLCGVACIIIDARK